MASGQKGVDFHPKTEPAFSSKSELPESGCSLDYLRLLDEGAFFVTMEGAVAGVTAVVASFDDVAVVSQLVEQRGDHPGVVEVVRHSAKLTLVVMAMLVCSQSLPFK